MKSINYVEKDYDTIDDLTRGDFYCNYRKKSKVISYLKETSVSLGSIII